MNIQQSDFLALRQGKTGLFPFLVIAFAPLALLDLRLPLPGIQVRLSDFYLIALFGCFLLKYRDALSWTLRTTYLFVPFLLYILLHSVLTGNRSGIVELIQWGFVLLWVPVLSYVLRDADDALMVRLVICLMLVALYVALAHIAGGDWVRYKKMGDARYTFGLFSLVSALCLLRFNSPRDWFIFLLAVLLMGLSLERNGLVIFLVTMFLVVPIMALKPHSLFVSVALLSTKLAVFTSGFLAYFLLFRGSVSLTYFLDEQRALWESDLHRANLIANGVRVYLDHPWFGVGGKMLREAMRPFYLDSGLALYTHNWYLDFFIEYGVVGVLLFMVAIVPAVFGVSAKHRLAWVLVPLAFYCFCAPVFMANGTTTMLLYLTAVACCQATAWSGARGETSHLA